MEERLVRHISFLHHLPDSLVMVWSQLLLDALCLGRKLVTGAPRGEHGGKPLCLLLRVGGWAGQRRRLSSRSSTAAGLGVRERMNTQANKETHGILKAHPTYTDEEILLYITNNDIDHLTNCWCTTDETQFKKLRNGLIIQDLTPPPNKATKTSLNRNRHSST